MTVCNDMIVMYSESEEKITLTKKELDEIIKSSLNVYYKNGYTNTASKLNENILKEVDYFKKCKHQDKLYIPLSKENDFSRDENFTFTYDEYGNKVFIK